MGLAAVLVRRVTAEDLWRGRDRAWTALIPTSHDTTHVAQVNTGIDHLSTNRGPYPQVRTSYPHLAYRLRVPAPTYLPDRDPLEPGSRTSGTSEGGHESAYSISRTAPTSRRKSSFSAISRSIFSHPCNTVEWSRPPSASPIRISGASVSSRIKYMAIWRGRTTCLSRAFPLI